MSKEDETWAQLRKDADGKALVEHHQRQAPVVSSVPGRKPDTQHPIFIPKEPDHDQPSNDGKSEQGKS